jgi:uncharacterized membrane protein
MKKTILLLAIIFAIVLPLQIKAQDQSQQTPPPQQQNPIIVKAKVTEIVSTGTEDTNPFSGQPGQASQNIPTQDIKAIILEGKDSGKTIELTNDYTPMQVGDDFYLSENPQPDGTFQYTVSAPYRINSLIALFLAFLVLVFLFGGVQGMRGIISLFGSLLLIVFVLIPGILHGFSPIYASLGVASLIIILGSYITHGFNKTTTVAVVGMVVTIALTGALTYYAIHANQLTGADENAFYLNQGSQINIDLVGLLFGGIMIGLLGVLYDIAISQAIAIEELHKIAPHVNRWAIYKRAIRIGKEHIGALVGTLAIAYVGVALPLILLYTKTGFPLLVTINQEIFATEIVRILVSSIGLILAVPITTILAIYIIIRHKEGDVSQETMEQEKEKLEHANHSH